MGDAVDGHRPPSAVGAGHGGDELVEFGKAVVGDDELDRAALELRPRARVEPRTAGHHEVLGERAVGDGGGQQGQILTPLGRRGIGEPGHAVLEQCPADGGEVERLPGNALPEPGVEPEQAPGGATAGGPLDTGDVGRGQAEAVDGGRVEHPHRPAPAGRERSHPAWCDRLARPPTRDTRPPESTAPAATPHRRRPTPRRIPLPRRHRLAQPAPTAPQPPERADGCGGHGAPAAARHRRPRTPDPPARRPEPILRLSRRRPGRPRCARRRCVLRPLRPG